MCLGKWSLSQHWKSKTIVWFVKMEKIISPIYWGEVSSPRNHFSWRNHEYKEMKLRIHFWAVIEAPLHCSLPDLLHSYFLLHHSTSSGSPTCCCFPIGTAFQASKLWIHILANPCTPNWCGTNGLKIIHLVISSSHNFFFLKEKNKTDAK